MTPAGRLRFWATLTDRTSVAFRAFPGLVGLDLIAVWVVSGRGSAGRSWPRCSGSGEGGGEVADQRRVRTGCGEGEADAGCGLDDAGAELQQPQSQGGELGDRQRVRFWDGVAQAEDQPVGSGMQEQAHLVCQRRAAAGAVRGELALVQLDQILRLAAGAVETFVDVFGRAGFAAGDDVTDVETLRGGFDAGTG